MKLSRAWRLTMVVGCAVCLLSVTAGWHRWPRARPFSLVVTTFDTTRADRIGAYGYRNTQTPVIDGLAHDGVLVEQATASAPLTLPAHGSIFTGQYPPQSEVSQLGHFVIAGVLMKQGRPDAARELETGRALEACLERQGK